MLFQVASDCVSVADAVYVLLEGNPERDSFSLNSWALSNLLQVTVIYELCLFGPYQALILGILTANESSTANAFWNANEICIFYGVVR